MLKEKDVPSAILASLYRLGEKYEDYDTIIQRVRIIADPTCDHAWMNARCVIGYNPRFMCSLTADLFDGVVEHELAHYVGNHFVRAVNLAKVLKRHNAGRWNRAADLEINSKVKNLPEWVCWPKSYGLPENLTAEEYYMHLENMSEVQESGGPGGMSGDLRSCDGSTEISESDAQIQEDIIDEYEKAKSRGKGKGRGSDEVKLKPKKPIDIHSYLRVMASNMSRNPTFGFEDINYNKFGKSAIPSILTFAQNNFLPIIKLAFIVDTSGSRTNTQINTSISRIWSTLQTLEVESTIVDMFEVDDGVQKVTRIRNRRDIPTHFSGRGGTVLSGAYEEFKIDYNLVIVMTDGYVYWGEFDSIPAKYRHRTIFGIDEKSYFATYQDCKFPVFIL